MPNGISELHALQLLELSNNTLHGTVPTGIRALSALKILSLHTNQFQGQFPWGAVSATGLLALKLGANRFSGTIPESLSALSMLELLLVGNNSLEGALTSIASASLSSLSVLHYAMSPPEPSAAHCGGLDVAGTVPRTISALSKLKGVVFENNRLSGTICHLSAMPRLEEPRIGGNNFTACAGMSPACVPPTCSWQLVAVAGPLGDMMLGQNDAATEQAEAAMEQLHEAEVAPEVTASPSPSHGMWDMENDAEHPAVNTARAALRDMAERIAAGAKGAVAYHAAKQAEQEARQAAATSSAHEEL